MSKVIAISFDDAPLYDGPLLTGDERTQMLIEALAAMNAEATFFVTPKDFAQPGSHERIIAYENAGHLIANHTNHHNAASLTDIDLFMADVDETTDFLIGFSNYRPWFRFPYLDEGSNIPLRDAYRAALAERGLDNGNATVDTFDWYMQDLLSQALYAGDPYDLSAFRDAYVEMIVDAANYYDALSNETFGRSVAQVLMLHENDLAAMFIDDAIAALRADGWEIISSDEAYADPIYDIQPETLQTGRGLLAALAIDAGADGSILNHQGNTTAGIDALLEKHNALGGDGDSVISGDAGDNTLFGTDGDDVFIGEAGRDVMVGAAGSDIHYGDAEGVVSDVEYDQVNYAGDMADYGFSLNADGSVAVVKPDGGVDMLFAIEGFWFYDEEAWYSLAQALANFQPGGEITGTDGDDDLYGSDGDDVVIALGGFDEIVGSAGNDVIDGGGDEYDQVDYDGKAEDYAFTANDDGSTSVLKPNGGIDTLTDIDGFWFYGEEAWYSLEQLLQPPNHGGVITGTEGDDFLIGAEGDDVINALGGRDEIVGTQGNDVIDGGGDEYDQVDYPGHAADYIFTANSNGSVSVAKPEGDGDILYDIDGFWFFGEAAWYSLADMLAASGGARVGTDGDDYLYGTDGDDFIDAMAGQDVIDGSAGDDVIDGGGDEYDQVDYDGFAADYVFSRNDNGTVSVAKPDGGVDLLSDIDGFWFRGEEAWYSLEQLLDVGASATMSLLGGDDDEFLIPVDEGQAVVGWSGDDGAIVVASSENVFGQVASSAIVEDVPLVEDQLLLDTAPQPNEDLWFGGF